MLLQRAQWSELSGGISSLTALALGWGALPSCPAGLEAVCPGQQQQHHEFTLEIPGSSHPGAGNVREENVLAPRGTHDATLGKKADTSSCHRDPAVTMQPLGSSSPAGRARGLRGNCRVSDHRGHHSLEGWSLPSPAGPVSRQGRMG